MNKLKSFSISALFCLVQIAIKSIALFRFLIFRNGAYSVRNHLPVMLHIRLVRPGTAVRGQRRRDEATLLRIKNMNFPFCDETVPAVQGQRSGLYRPPHHRVVQQTLQLQHYGTLFGAAPGVIEPKANQPLQARCLRPAPFRHITRLRRRQASRYSVAGTCSNQMKFGSPAAPALADGLGSVLALTTAQLFSRTLPHWRGAISSNCSRVSCIRAASQQCFSLSNLR